MLYQWLGRNVFDVAEGPVVLVLWGLKYFPCGFIGFGIGRYLNMQYSSHLLGFGDTSYHCITASQFFCSFKACNQFPLPLVFAYSSHLN